jgi:hypothetical protein
MVRLVLLRSLIGVTVKHACTAVDDFVFFTAGRIFNVSWDSPGS